MKSVEKLQYKMSIKHTLVSTHTQKKLTTFYHNLVSGFYYSLYPLGYLSLCFISLF